jgi:propionyl-CoA carboxylase beta chain
MHEVIGGIIDEDSFEIHKNYAENILVGFALGGKSIGL